MNYPGKELENFDSATIWRKYVYFLIKKYIKGNILEVGAGIGSFTNNYSLWLVSSSHELKPKSFKCQNYFCFQVLYLFTLLSFLCIIYLEPQK